MIFWHVEGDLFQDLNRQRILIQAVKTVGVYDDKSLKYAITDYNRLGRLLMPYKEWDVGPSTTKEEFVDLRRQWEHSFGKMSDPETQERIKRVSEHLRRKPPAAPERRETTWKQLGDEVKKKAAKRRRLARGGNRGNRSGADPRSTKKRAGRRRTARTTA